MTPADLRAIAVAVVDERYAAAIATRLGAHREEAITTMQQRLRPRHVVTPRTQREFRRTARWWELEAMRGYDSSAKSLEYAANMRWLAELMDAGVTVVGRRFDEIVKEQARR